MQKSESIAALASALAKAQAAFGPIPRDKTVKVRTKSGGEYTFSYAPLETILAAVRKPLSDNGISLLQEVQDDKVVTTILHESGEFYSSGGTPIKVAEQGAQAYGSGLTYSRRYDVTLLLNLCADDDDDGNGADGNESTATKKQGRPKSDSPSPISGPITPNGGAMDNVPPERREYVNRIASTIIDCFTAEQPGEAYKTYLSVTDHEEKLGVWSLLDSKQRRALKTMDQNARLAEQA